MYKKDERKSKKGGGVEGVNVESESDKRNRVFGSGVSLFLQASFCCKCRCRC